MNEPVKYAAEVNDVRELSLRGSADLQYCREFLEPYGLAPLEREGRARIMITAAQLRWAGLRFLEVDFAVELLPSKDSSFPDAACLLQAFNTNRFFAFCERAFFHTPYAGAPCEISLEAPRRIRVGASRNPAFAAELARLPDPLPPPAPGGLFGPVYVLPKNTDAPLRHFIAKIEGATRIFPFDPEADSLRISTIGPGASALRRLLDGGFTPETWILRENAFHAKSPTRQGPSPL